MPSSRDSRHIDLSFLEGPRSRWKEFTSVLSIAGEFIRGFRALHFVGPCVSVFGSARFAEDHPYYQLARAVGNPPFLLRVEQQDVTVQRGDEQHQRAEKRLAELRARLQDPAMRSQLAAATGQAMRTASVLLTSSRNP